MAVEFVQVLGEAAGESKSAVILVALISGASGALVGITAGVLGYVATVKASKNNLAASKHAADAQRDAAAKAAAAQLQAAEAAARAQLASAEQASATHLEAMRLQTQLDTSKLRAAHVTTERLRWLQDLRQRLSLLYRDLDTQVDLLRRAGEGMPDAAATQAELDKLSDRVMLEVHMITLMLNPEKDDQRMLRQSLEQIQEVVQQMFVSGRVSDEHMRGYSGLKTQSFAAMVRIGVTAWRRIQALE